MRKLWKIVPLAAVGLLAGCAGTYETGYGYSYGYDDYYGDIYTDLAPPQPLVEVVPPRPGVSHAWINGYWAWDGSRYAWRRGYWDRAPSGHAWLRHGWVPYQGRYRYVPGRWVPQGRYPSVPYAHRFPDYRYGRQYGVIPYAQSAPYAYVPRQYHYRGPTWARPGDADPYGPRARVYRNPRY